MTFKNMLCTRLFLWTDRNRDCICTAEILKPGLWKLELLLFPTSFIHTNSKQDSQVISIYTHTAQDSTVSCQPTHQLLGFFFVVVVIMSIFLYTAWQLTFIQFTWLMGSCNQLRCKQFLYMPVESVFLRSCPRGKEFMCFLKRALRITSLTLSHIAVEES